MKIMEVPMKTDIFVEFHGQRIDTKTLTDNAKEIWKDGGNKVKDLESLELYVQPETGKCYYVLNDTTTGEFGV